MKRLWLLVPASALALMLVAQISAAEPPTGLTTGTARVFVPNPVQSLGDESLTDQKDSDAAVPAAAYHTVTLTNLDGKYTDAWRHYQPRVSSSSSGASAAAERPLIASPSPRETRARISPSV